MPIPSALLVLQGGDTPALSACRCAAETALTFAALVSISPRQWLYTRGGQRAANSGCAPSADAASSL